jgi:phosphoribosylformylglycinamidine synthase
VDGAYAPGQEILVPVKNGEGRYVAAPDELERLEGEGRVAVRYVGGNPTAASAASRRDQRRRPRRRADAAPEHAVEDLTGPSTDGLGFFTSVLTAAVGA